MNTRMKVIALFVFSLVALSSFGPLSQKVNAYTPTGISGKPGKVVVSKVVGSHYPGQTSWGTVWSLWLSDSGTTVYRSPATTGAQKVASQYTIYRWNGSRWAAVTSTQMMVHTIPAGVNAVKMPLLSVQPTSPIGYYRVVQTIIWTTSNGSTLLGSFTADMNQNSDYQCNTLFQCFIKNGSIYLGRTV